MDIGVLQTGAQTVPIYPTISEKEYEYIFNHSDLNTALFLMKKF
jgi:long-chain acyl-CoA synthetase